LKFETVYKLAVHYGLTNGKFKTLNIDMEKLIPEARKEVWEIVENLWETWHCPYMGISGMSEELEADLFGTLRP